MSSSFNKSFVVSGALFGLGAGLIVGSLSSTYWMKSDSLREYYGLFKACIKSKCGDLHWTAANSEGEKLVSNINKTKALASVSVVAAMISLITACVFNYKARRGSVTRGLLYTSFVFSVLTVIMTTVACIVYKSDVFDVIVETYRLAGQGAQDWEIGYSFYLAVVGGPMVFLGGLPTLILGLIVKTTPPQEAQAVGYGVQQGQGQVNVISGRQ